MKTSNKILLGGFLTTVLVLLAVDVAIYARYKAGNYVPFSDTQSEEASSSTVFKNANHVNIRYLQNVVVRVGDQLKVERFGKDESNIVITENDGTVKLSLKDSINKDQLFEYVIVYVPESSDIITYKSNLTIEGGKGKAFKNMHINASGGHIALEQDKNMLQIDSLNVVASNSTTIELQNTHINNLSIQLNTSELIDQQAIINQLQLNADSASRVNLQTKNLLNVITKTSVHE